MLENTQTTRQEKICPMGDATPSRQITQPAFTITEGGKVIFTSLIYQASDDLYSPILPFQEPEEDDGWPALDGDTEEHGDEQSHQASDDEIEDDDEEEEED